MSLDDGGWGFCDYCAFLVVVEGGVRIEHPRYRIGSDASRCNGSGRPAVTPTPYCAKARQVVSLHKVYGRSARRAHYQRQRWLARARLISLTEARDGE